MSSKISNDPRGMEQRVTIIYQVFFFPTPNVSPQILMGGKRAGEKGLRRNHCHQGEWSKGETYLVLQRHFIGKSNSWSIS